MDADGKSALLTYDNKMLEWQKQYNLLTVTFFSGVLCNSSLSCLAESLHIYVCNVYNLWRDNSKFLGLF